ncbi:MAG: hypothetical protein OEM94_04580 [Acidimicrobiia bacterium]|nr:hypothetical protein [Acidimicrobiia bacterium]MDH3470575.1 hypothetical protein [Acidimicrobiia bacterium]
MTGRLERRLLRLNDRIAALERQEHLAFEELNMHRHLDDDAQRDAAVGGPVERADSRDTAADVSRFEKVVAGLATKRNKLVEKRDQLTARLR